MIYAPRSFDLDAYVRELPPDLGRVLLKVAVVEEWLEGLLLVHLDLDEAGVAKQFGDYGPLNSFGKKIRKAHELHLIDDETEANLIVLKEVRNAFAHTRRHLDLIIAGETTRPVLGAAGREVARAPNFIGDCGRKIKARG